MFADRARIIIKSGKGGDGHVSFRREKYVPDGGPNGGDGGRGGDVVFIVDKGMNTLTDYRHKHKFAAGDGEEGGKNNCRGKDGEDRILKVPEGTVIKDAASGRVIADMSGSIEMVKILSGGRGGLGNQHFATSTMQAPKYAQPGKPSKELEVFLEMKLIADVGLVGFPSVGKSSLIRRVSNARPEVADYHFTTITPHLGVVDMGDGNSFVMADIPGLIEGAADGMGLGHDFLRHIERNRLLVHILDAAGVEGRDPLDDYRVINEELGKYGDSVASIPQIVVANKCDLIPAEPEPVDIDENGEFIYPEDPVERIRKKAEADGRLCVAISAATGEGIEELKYAIYNMLKELPEKKNTFEQEYDPDKELEKVEEALNIYYDEAADEFVIEGSRIDKMMGYTNLDSEKGFLFFQNFMKEEGILDELKKLGINEGDTVRVSGLVFDYYE
ncbi:MAG: GTPase ObgE [Lachnospiraceae bacterium]|nr:GTPase ObgE [Lachnospiraceae bacterium]